MSMKSLLYDRDFYAWSRQQASSAMTSKTVSMTIRA